MAKDVLKAVGSLTVLAALALLLISAAEPGDAEVAQESTIESTEVVVSEPQVARKTASVPLAELVQAGTAVGTDYAQLPESIEKKHGLPRYNWHGKHVDPHFCGGPQYYDKKECSEEYQQSLVLTAAPLILVALVTMLFWLVFLCGRFCFTCCDAHGAGCCGGRYPTKGVCCGELREADNGYSLFDNRLFIFLIVAVVVLVVVGAIVGSTGNSQLSSGIQDLLDVTEAIPGKLQHRVSTIQTELTALQTLAGGVNPYLSASMWASLQTGLDQVSHGAANMLNQVEDSVKVIRKYEGERSSYFHSALWIPAGISVLAILGYWCPMLLLLVVVPLAVFVTFTVWIAVGFHIPVSVATADLCVGLDQGLKHPNTSSPLDLIVGCHGATGASQMATASAYFEQASVGVACTTLDQLCNASALSYPDKHGDTHTLDPVTCPSLACSNETLATFVNQTVIRDFQYGCATLEAGDIVLKDCVHRSKADAESSCLSAYGNTDIIPCLPGSTELGSHREVSLVQCNASCLLNTTQNASATVLGNAELNSRFKAVESERIQPLMNCSFIREQATVLEHTLCWDVVEATDLVMSGLSIIGISLFFGIFFYLGGAKRFHTRYLADYGWWPKERQKLIAKATGQSEASGDGTGDPLLAPPIQSTETKLETKSAPAGSFEPPQGSLQAVHEAPDDDDDDVVLRVV